MSDLNGTIYAHCAASYDTTNQLGSLLKCMSNLQEQRWQNAVDSIPIETRPDILYVNLAGALVFFMQLGFAMLCAGSIRAKNVRNVILWNLLDSCGGGIFFWAVGWGFIYGGDDPTSPKKTFLGNSQFFFNLNSGGRFDFFFFQFTFACALSSIVAGTIAERLQMKAYLLYSAFLVSFVYPVVAHALWSYNGFLSPFNVEPLFGSGAIDLAGSGAVHMCGGVAALAGGIVLGPRTGRFHDEDGNLLDEPKEFPPHSVSLQFLGTFALWFGWYGFNSGSAYFLGVANSEALTSIVIVNTTLAACAGAISAMFTSSFFDWRHTGVATYDCAYTMNGCLTGLVAITAPACTVDTWAAVVIGIVAGWLYLAASKTLLRLKIDDAVDAIPVHMVGGAWGLLSTGLFSAPQQMAWAFPANTSAGWFYEWGLGSANFGLCGSQLIAILFIFAWCFPVMGGWFYFLNMMGWLRVDPLEEEVGLDQSRHKGAAYDITATSDEKLDQLNLSRSQHKKVTIPEGAASAPTDQP